MRNRFSHSSSRLQRAFLVLIAALALALALGTLSSGPHPVAAQEDGGFRIGLPSPVIGDPVGNARMMYRDSSVSVNTVCPVRKGRIDPNRDPVYVNGQAVGFCCQPCPSIFSFDPEKYLREMKVAFRCPVRPTRRAIFDSSLRAQINQDIFFFSSPTAMKQFQKDPLRYCGKLTDPVTRARFRPTSASPHVTFRGRVYYFAADSSLAKFQERPERFYERTAGT